jgi:hypothetical protein
VELIVYLRGGKKASCDEDSQSRLSSLISQLNKITLPLMNLVYLFVLSPNLLTFKEPRN